MLDRHERLGITERDVIINYLPLFHIFGYVDGPLSTLIGGHRQVLTETFDADAALDLVEREGGTLLHGFETHMPVRGRESYGSTKSLFIRRRTSC